MRCSRRFLLSCPASEDCSEEAFPSSVAVVSLRHTIGFQSCEQLANQRQMASRRLASRCQRSATCNASGAPSVAPYVKESPRSRLKISTPRWRDNQSRNDSLLRSGSKSIGRRVSRSQRIVPSVCRLRKAKSSKPSTLGTGCFSAIVR